MGLELQGALCKIGKGGKRALVSVEVEIRGNALYLVEGALPGQSLSITLEDLWKYREAIREQGWRCSLGEGEYIWIRGQQMAIVLELIDRWQALSESQNPKSPAS